MSATAQATNGAPWHPVTRDEPCPICEKGDRCKLAPGGDRVICFRESSDRPTKNGAGEGWYHDLDPSAARPKPGPRVTFGADGKAKPKAQNVSRVATECAARLTPELRDELAAELGLPAEAPDALPGLGYLSGDGPGGGCWTLPECDAAGKVVGLGRRYRGGGKMHMDGHSRGLTLPAGWRELTGRVYVC